MEDSSRFYDGIAGAYEGMRVGRRAYLTAIDEVVVSYLNRPMDHLDVGAGDGVRALGIWRRGLGGRLTLLDESEELLRSADVEGGVEICRTAFQDYRTDKRFDLITCLWNVMGHVGDEGERRDFIRKMKTLLRPDGIIIMDVNNRYNVRAYGYEQVMRNIKQDLQNGDNSGWFVLRSGQYETRVYVHRPLEIEEICNDLGMRVEAVRYFDYDCGSERSTFLEGQLCYVISNNGEV